jgi:hypothetical protein
MNGPAVVDSIINSREHNQNFGDWGAPGSGGIRYRGGGTGATTSSNRDAIPTARHQSRRRVSEWRHG